VYQCTNTITYQREARERKEKLIKCALGTDDVENIMELEFNAECLYWRVMDSSASMN